MRVDNRKTALATRCLWGLQETVPDIIGLLLTNISGLAIASTVSNADRAQKLAALSSTMFLLGEHACEELGRGEPQVVALKFYDAVYDDVYILRFLPVTENSVLVVIYRSEKDMDAVHPDVDLARHYLMALLDNHQILPTLRWKNK